MFYQKIMGNIKERTEQFFVNSPPQKMEAHPLANQFSYLSTWKKHLMVQESSFKGGWLFYKAKLPFPELTMQFTL